MRATAVRLMGAVAGVVGALAYSSFLLGPAVHSTLSPTTSFPSELEAAGQPYAAFFRLTDIVSGLLIVVVAWALYRLLPRDRSSSPGCLLIAVMGAASVSDGATTMGCAPSLNAACHARDETITGLLSQTFESHTLSGLAGFLGGAGGMLMIGLALRRSPAASSMRWGTASRNLSFVLGAVGLIDLVLLAVDQWFGLAERARPLIVSLWLLGAAAYLVTLLRPKTHRDRFYGSRFGAIGATPAIRSQQTRKFR